MAAVADKGRPEADTKRDYGADVTIKDLEGEPFILHRLCSTTEAKILKLFEQNLRLKNGKATN